MTDIIGKPATGKIKHPLKISADKNANLLSAKLTESIVNTANPMTDIIDKVAEAISKENYHCDYELNATYKSLATAALEALAEGLVWDECGTLRFNGALVDGIHGGPKKWFTNKHLLKVYQTKEEAKKAATTEARRVLFGLGPIGGENG
jgi:hypothetical protein